ncbi:hypothetical protein [Pseudonocardia sp. T1-2H]|uniref:hypothetical protein n=1 Tax=Pseudonocardia sp. T1-2H TaxID=3128899 RepID=UPI003100FC08
MKGTVWAEMVLASPGTYSRRAVLRAVGIRDRERERKAAEKRARERQQDPAGRPV